MVIDRAPVPPAAWRDLARETGRFYDDPRWIRGIAEFFRFPLVCLSAREGDAVVGALALARVPALLGPSRLVSLPFSYAGGVMGSARDGGAALFEAARGLARECRVTRVEIKQRDTGTPPAPGFTRSTHYAAYRVATAGGERAVWDGLHTSTQRSIRKGQGADVTAAPGSDEEDWLAMAALEERTARQHGVPPPPRAFFGTFCRELQQAGLADLYLARLRSGRLAAGLVVWKGRREWIYAFGASDRRVLEHRPNHVLLWSALADAVRAGVVFDLGRAAAEQTGLVEFKRRWGGQRVPLAYDYWPMAGGLNVRRRDGGMLALAARAWSLLPLPLVRLGARLYRYLG
ncbi:MAG: GNAT family N-acetyltransferase [Gemmatimonadales bacterium]